MLNFFRKIRKKLAYDIKPWKYMRYAIGEILLVVVGILIALQINNWNEKRIAVRKEKNYIQSIYQDLKADLADIERNIENLTHQYTTGIKVLRALEHKESAVLDSATLTSLIAWDLSQIIPVERKENTWDGLKVQGTHTYIINDTFKGLLNSFYGNYDIHIERFNQLPKKVRQELRELTGTCHDANSVQSIFENGIQFYGKSSFRLRRCILTNERVFRLVGAISVSAIVNMGLNKELKNENEAVLNYMENQFNFLLE